MAENGNLSARQKRFAEAYMVGSSIAKAAETCQIPPRTAYRWMRDPDVMGYIREEMAHIHRENLATLTRAGRAAIITLIRCLDAKSEFVRVQAAGKLLDLEFETFKVVELEALLEELKERIPHERLRRIN